MPLNSFDRILSSISVALKDFAICQIQRDRRLALPPQDAISIHYVLAGSGMLDAGEGQQIALSEHSVVVLPAGRRFSLGSSARGTVEHFALDKCATLANGLMHYKVGNGDGLVCVCGSITANYAGTLGLFDHLQGPLVAQTHALDPLRGLFQMMLVELSNPNLGMLAAAEALMKLCLVALVRDQVGNGEAMPPFLLALQDPQLAGSVAAMVENPSDNHTVQTLADLVSMSRSVFAERFTLVFGKSPIDFLQSVRLERAARLLQTTDLPIKQISAAVGLKSRSHFSRSFRSRYEMDPTTFRMAQHDDSVSARLPAL